MNLQSAMEVINWRGGDWQRKVLEGGERMIQEKIRGTRKKKKTLEIRVEGRQKTLEVNREAKRKRRQRS